MEKNSAEDFLAVFNKTEKWMKKTIGARDEDGYSSVLKRQKIKIRL
ncbi:hypothetical protein H1D32_20985 [Anaerobacillus sp. CMMVII]|nr:hypothetical protein [Anaerobacillus sp. CMMVII]MCT8139954.1 hypothetical protein [Anaerobacillus sp. CMMVII]